MHRTFRSFIVTLIVASPLVLAGCCKESSADAPTSTKTDESKPFPKGWGPQRCRPGSLAAEIQVAKDGMGAMDMSMGDRQERDGRHRGRGLAQHPAS